MVSKKKVLRFETFRDVYTANTQVGVGGAGIVHEVLNENGEKFALKSLKPEFVNKSKNKRFANEIKFCSEAKHTNIVEVLDYGFAVLKDEKCPFYVMRYYPRTLRRLINNSISANDILPIFSQMIDGIEYAHLRCIWHRDLKPENILCDTDNKNIVVADFGIAHFEQDQMLTAVETKDSERLANFPYAAPEQRVRDESVDLRADMYALGLILNEMFTGKLASGTDYLEIGSVEPEFAYLDPIVNRLLKSDPNARYEKIDDLKSDLIAHKNKFISRQRISRLSKMPIKEDEIDHPLVVNPIRLREFDYRDGNIILHLTTTVDSEWKKVFYSVKWRNAPHGVTPGNFKFVHDFASLQLQTLWDSTAVQSIVDSFKEWVDLANQDFSVMLKEKRDQGIAVERDQLYRKQKEEERRLRLISSIKT